MTMNPLPPQAYTKDTLTKAYTWLLHQSPSIKEMASTPDILVSLFLKAQRDGDEALERPSLQNFKNELKSLAGLMGELENGKNSPPAVQVTPVHVHNPPPPATPTPVVQQTLIQQNNHHSHVTVDLKSLLDPKSQAMLAEVKDQLNLSSDIEVIRLLLSLGYHKAKTLYS